MTSKKEDITPPPAWHAVENYVSEQICLLHQKQRGEHDEATHLLQMMAYLSGLTTGLAMEKNHAYDASILIGEFVEYITAVGIAEGHPNQAALHTSAAKELARLVRYAHVGEE
jgi:hypothetical protein